MRQNLRSSRSLLNRRGSLLALAFCSAIALTAPLAAADSGPVTSDADALAALNLDAPGMEQVKAAAANHDMAAVKKAFLDYRRSRSTARFTVMPDQQPAKPVAANDPAGDKIMDHKLPDPVYRTGGNVDMGHPFKWTYNPVKHGASNFSDEWTWSHVGRMAYWKTLGDAYWKTGNEKYAAEWVVQLVSFITENRSDAPVPPNASSLWRTLDSAIRMHDAWPYSYYHFLRSPSFTADAHWLYFRSVLDHVRILKGGLADLRRTGNWVTTESYGIYTIGTLFPECQQASSWRTIATDRLTHELNHMVAPDGMEAEFSPTYHFVSAGGFLGPCRLARLNNQEIPEVFRNKVISMYRATALFMDPTGRTVAVGDSVTDGVGWWVRQATDAIGHDPLLDWAAGDQKGPRPADLPNSTSLPYSGFYALRAGWNPNDLYLFFRSGPIGIGHEHQDMLEVVLRAWGKELLPDFGNYPYDHSEWRRYTINTPSHNTIIVDGKWQHSPPTKLPITEKVNNPFITTPSFDYVSGTYSAGYQQNEYVDRIFLPQRWVGEPDKSVSHTRRVLLLRPSYVLVLDTLDGTGKHTFDAHFHIDAPSAHLDEKTQAAFSQNPDVQVALFPLERQNLQAQIIQGQEKPLLGWMPREHRPLPTVRFRKEQEVPAVFATLLYPYRGAAPAVTSEPLALKDGDTSMLWARRLQTPVENAELILARDNKPHALHITSSRLGDTSATATALILRAPLSSGASDITDGAWDITELQSAKLAFTLPSPATLTWRTSPLAFYNAGTEPVTMKLTRPQTAEVTLKPGAWITITASSVIAPPAEKP